MLHCSKGTICKRGQTEVKNSIDYPELVSVIQATKILNISRTLLYKLMEKGEIPFVKIGDRRQIKIKDINEFIDLNTHRGDL